MVKYLSLCLKATFSGNADPEPVKDLGSREAFDSSAQGAAGAANGTAAGTATAAGSFQNGDKSNMPNQAALYERIALASKTMPFPPLQHHQQQQHQQRQQQQSVGPRQSSHGHSVPPGSSPTGLAAGVGPSLAGGAGQKLQSHALLFRGPQPMEHDTLSGASEEEVSGSPPSHDAANGG